MEHDRVEAPEIRYHVPIRQWSPGDRPREKMLRAGAGALTDAELIAVLVGTGTRSRDGHVSALHLGQALLRAHGSLYRLAQRDVKELMRATGVGPAKAAQLVAAFEMGRRMESQRGGERVQICSPDDIAAIYGPLMRDLKREVFKVVLLNTANVVIGDYNASEGGLAASIVEPRAVFQKAILENAAAVICLHNHPSGNPEPSRDDLKVTRQLVEAGKVVGIPVHDHIIIAGRGFTSLAERGALGV